MTPEDMLLKDELMVHSLKLAIKISKICEMNEAQFKNLLQHRRDFLCHKKPVYVLPCVESIFDNQELIKLVLQVQKPAVRKRRRRKKLELVSVPQRSNSAEREARELAYSNNLLEHEVAVRNLRKKYL